MNAGTDIERVRQLERSYIYLYDSYREGHNKNPGGAGSAGHSDATRKRISDATKGRPSWNKGKKTPAEAIQKMVDTKTGMKDTDAARANKSKAQTRRYAIPENRKVTSDRMYQWWKDRKRKQREQSNQLYLFEID